MQTGEGALNEVHSMLQRVRDLKVQYANGTLEAERQAGHRPPRSSSCGKEISTSRSKTEFNGIKLLNRVSRVTFQVGAKSADTIVLTTTDAVGRHRHRRHRRRRRAHRRRLRAPRRRRRRAVRRLTLDDIDEAIKNVSNARSTFGAVQNRLEHRLNNLATYQENLVASESRIRDVDMAQEMVNFTKLGILQQAGTSMLAQANQAPQGVLSLLQG